MPRAARALRANDTWRCGAVNAGWDNVVSRNNGTAGILSKPRMRRTSSTRQASPSTSKRQEGGVAIIRLSQRVALNPKAFRIFSASPGSTSMPPSVDTRFGSSAIAGSGAGMSPAMDRSLASPPHNSSIKAVAASAPQKVDAGSTPRSKR